MRSLPLKEKPSLSRVYAAALHRNAASDFVVGVSPPMRNFRPQKLCTVLVDRVPYKTAPQAPGILFAHGLNALGGGPLGRGGTSVILLLLFRRNLTLLHRPEQPQVQHRKRGGAHRELQPHRRMRRRE